jgi:hypothetical protein
MSVVIIRWLAAVSVAGTCLAEDLASQALSDRLLAENEKIQSVQCEIHRETDVAGRAVQTLSRVWFQRPDRLRVETAAPEVRRIVVDGKAIHKWIDGQALGVRIPLAQAPEWDLLQVRRTPATADEYLLRLRGVPETTLPQAEGFSVRRAYTPAAPHPYTVLSLDATGRLARLEFFDSPARTNRLLRVDFERWREVKPGIWIACLQKTEARRRDGIDVRETVRVSALAVNDPIEPDQFDVARRMPGVTFVTTEEMEKVLRRGDTPSQVPRQ